MSRQLRDLTVDVLADLPEPCRSCVFWEVADAPRGAAPDGQAAKESWLQATQLEWGAPGLGCYVDDQLVAFGVLAPGEHVGRARRLGCSVSDDALLLSTLWVAPSVRKSGVARVLLQALLRETHQRGGRALEAFGARGETVFGTCVIPEGFLLANGFAVLHEDARYPLLRLDLRQTVRWQESLSQALEAVLGSLPRRARVPSPARPSPR